MDARGRRDEERLNAAPRRALRARRGQTLFSLSALAAGALAALVALLAPLALTPARYLAEAEVFIARSQVSPDETLAPEAALIASPDLARRAIAALGAGASRSAATETDPVEAPHAGAPDTALADFRRRLSVARPSRDRILAVRFLAADPEFAADAANRVASLFVETGRDAAGRKILASVVSPARARRSPVFPELGGWLTAATAALAAGGAVAARRRLPRRRGEAPLEPPRAIGEPGPVLSSAGPSNQARPEAGRALGRRETLALEDATRLILRARPADGPIRILAATLPGAEDSGDLLLALARRLSPVGRSILIDLADFAGAPSHGTGPGVAELTSGGASFGEVIRRDSLSRLHLAPAGDADTRARHAPGADFAAILDALDGAYDFIWVGLADGCALPAYEAHVDMLVLTAPPGPRLAFAGGRLGQTIIIPACGARAPGTDAA